MGSCYSDDHRAKDHIHTDIACKIEDPKQNYRLGTVSYWLGWMNWFTWSKPSSSKCLLHVKVSLHSFSEMNVAYRKEWDAIIGTSDTNANSIGFVANIRYVLYDHLSNYEQYLGNRRASLLHIHCSIFTEIVARKSLGIAQLYQSIKAELA